MSTVPRQTLRLDLDQVVADYLRNLNIMLRGFRAVEGCDFLETFVPSEDPATSVRDLVELSRDAGVRQIVIGVSTGTARQLDRERLAGDVGEFTVTTTTDGIELIFSRDVATADLLDGIHPAYRRNLAVILGSITHEKPVPSAGSGDVVVAEREGIRLWLAVDARTRFIEEAGFDGAAEAEVRGLLEGACRILEGIPLVEAADHAVIRLEAMVRDVESPPPVRGAVLPQNAGEPFVTVQRLVRDVVHRYRSDRGLVETENVYDQPVADAWLRSSNDGRLAAARAALADVDGAGDVTIARLDGLRRLVVHCGDGLQDPAAQQAVLVRAERHLRTALRTPLQIVLEAKGDTNVIRHLEPRK